MAIEVDLDDFQDAEEALKPSSGFAAPGTYHAQVVEVEERDAKIRVEWEVVGPGDQCGRKFVQTLFTEPSAEFQSKNENAWKITRKGLLQFAHTVRMISKKEIEDAKAAGTGITLDFANSLVGCQAIVEVKEREYEDRKTGEKKKATQVDGWNVHDLADPKFENVPLNDDIAAMIGVVRAAGSKEEVPATKPAPASTATKPKAKPAPQPVGAGAGAGSSNGPSGPSGTYDDI